MCVNMNYSLSAKAKTREVSGVVKYQFWRCTIDNEWEADFVDPQNVLFGLFFLYPNELYTQNIPVTYNIFPN